MSTRSRNSNEGLIMISQLDWITDAQLAAAMLNHGWHPSFTHASNRSIFSCDQGPSPLGGGGGMTEPPIPRIRLEICSDRALTSPKLSDRCL
jgi:hypothetical protein